MTHPSLVPHKSVFLIVCNSLSSSSQAGASSLEPYLSVPGMFFELTVGFAYKTRRHAQDRHIWLRRQGTSLRRGWWWGSKLQISGGSNFIVIFDWQCFHNLISIVDGISYPPGGYVSNLGKSARNLHYILQNLAYNQWLDFQTSVLFIEFVAYNGDANIIANVKVAMEMLPSGDYRPTIKVSPSLQIAADEPCLRRIQANLSRSRDIPLEWLQQTQKAEFDDSLLRNRRARHLLI